MGCTNELDVVSVHPDSWPSYGSFNSKPKDDEIGTEPFLMGSIAFGCTAVKREPLPTATYPLSP